MNKRQDERPGCGGCLLLIMMLVFLSGGAPLLLRFMGTIMAVFFFGIIPLIAALFGWSYYIKRQVGDYVRSQTETHNRFVTLLINILIKIAQVDGVVTREEINIINGFFRNNLGYTQNQMFWVKETVRDAVRSTVPLDDLLAEFRQAFAYEPRLILLELIYQILYTKRLVPDAELALARNIAQFLQISAYDQRSIENKYRYGPAAASGEQAEERYFEILGLEPGVDFEKIKAAYRRLSMQYHPDKVGHLGEEFKQVAEEKMKDLNAAYDYLRKKYQNNA